ncbi:MAG: methyltransferase [Cellvibrionaceae bacterium]|nr:methyltransferase [Cellvibrionaceae bacterium]
MTCDTALDALLAELQRTTTPTLWYADENVLPIIMQLQPNPALLAITNRYDIYQRLTQRTIDSLFTDFDPEHYAPKHAARDVKKILYRLSKEKALVHHLINQGNQLLNHSGELWLFGHKNDGIKTYSDKIVKQLAGEGKLKKQRHHYVGRYTQLDPSQSLDDQDYRRIRKVAAPSSTLDYFYSKPGVFGWNKIDRGTQLLLSHLPNILERIIPQPQSILDLGCGYGWIFLNLRQYAFDRIIATDNNAGALACAQKNAQLTPSAVTVIASDCADTIDEQFDLVLCNPPFHQGHQHDKQLSAKFIENAAARLKPQGTALFVVNDFIALNTLSRGYFSRLSVVATAAGFSVYCLML